MNVSESWQGPAPGCRGSGKKPPKRSIFSCSISASPFFLGHPHSCCRATPYYRGKVPALSKSCDYQNGQPSEDLVTGWSVAVTIWRINRYRTDRSLTRTAAKIRTTNLTEQLGVQWITWGKKEAGSADAAHPNHTKVVIGWNIEGCRQKHESGGTAADA